MLVIKQPKTKKRHNDHMKSKFKVLAIVHCLFIIKSKSTTSLGWAARPKINNGIKTVTWPALFELSDDAMRFIADKALLFLEKKFFSNT